MLVCICAAVPEADFLQALKETGGDWRLAALHCGAGECCGTCRPFLSDLAQQALALHPASSAVVSEENKSS